MKDLTLVLLAFLMIGLVACEKDEDLSPNEVTNNRIQGEWNVSSWTIDGVEEIVPGFAMDMSFTKTGEANGTTEWRFFDGPVLDELIEFSYEIVNDGQRIDFGGGDIMSLDVSGDFLQLEGNIDGYRWELEAEKE